MRKTGVSRAPCELLSDIGMRVPSMRRDGSDLGLGLGLGVEGSLGLGVAETVVLSGAALCEVDSFGRAQVLCFARCAARERGRHFCELFAATVSSGQGNARPATFCFPLAALDE